MAAGTTYIDGIVSRWSNEGDCASRSWCEHDFVFDKCVFLNGTENIATGDVIANLKKESNT